MSKRSDSFISSWGYIGYAILWAIPVIGWIIWLFNCFSKNINKRNYARSILCAFIISLVATIVLGGLIAILLYLDVAPELTNTLREILNLIQNA